MTYFLLKSLHIIGFVSWFAGMFYLVRILVYYRESALKDEPERQILQTQFGIMMQRAYNIIMNPAMMITWIGGLGMIIHNEILDPAWLGTQGWLHVKLVLLVGLTIYHIHSKSIIKKFLAHDYSVWTPERLRMWNEVPTLFLFAIVLLAVLKNTLSFVLAMGILIGLVIFLMCGIKFYKRYREKRGE